MVIMRKSRLSRHKQDRLIEHFVFGATGRWPASLIGVNFKTCAYYFHNDWLRISAIHAEAIKVKFR